MASSRRFNLAYSWSSLRVGSVLRGRDLPNGVASGAMGVRADRSADDRVARERDLYLRILELGEQRELEPFLGEALRLIVDITRADHVYLELNDPVSGPGSDARWWISSGWSQDEVEQVRSRGIIDEVLGTGATVSTASAFTDPRFETRASVQRAKIQAVLCVPVGTDPPVGVFYLEGRSEPGAFSDADREQAELLARHIAPFADRVLARDAGRAKSDPTASVRSRFRSDSILGHSPALARVLEEAAIAAPLRDMNLLLTGQSGTGKSQLARVIHLNGPRESGPFVELNVAALPTELAENELFGAKKGAHSTATGDIEGKVAAAEGGTLFLDEIGELPLQLQAKLLQLLNSKEYYPLGANQSKTADVRIIAATNEDLVRAVEERRFRRDLYYRLEVLTIRLPSLEERRQDIVEIATGLCAAACERNQLPIMEFTPNARTALESAEWPGNVRQLENAISRAAARAAAEGSALIRRKHLFPDDENAADGDDELTWQEATREFQRSHLLRTLEETQWNVAETARRLELARSHVYNLMKLLQVDRPEAEG